MSDYEKNVRNAVMDVICNAMNFPKPASIHILGRDMGPLGDKIVAAVLPVVAATRTAALEEAAGIAEGELFWDPRGEVLSSDEVAYNVACREVSRAIRAAKEGAQ